MSDKYFRAENVFKALADRNRLQILDMLKNGEMYADSILVQLDIKQPTLSHHMKILCECGLVTERKDGRKTYYSVSEENRNGVFDLLEECIIQEGVRKAFEAKRKARKKDNIVIL